MDLDPVYNYKKIAKILQPHVFHNIPNDKESVYNVIRSLMIWKEAGFCDNLTNEKLRWCYDHIYSMAEKEDWVRKQKEEAAYAEELKEEEAYIEYCETRLSNVYEEEVERDEHSIKCYEQMVYGDEAA
jgi:hypothetical protein